MKFKSFHWPSEGPAVKLPKINTEKGKVKADTASHLEVYIPNKSKNFFEKYVQKCKTKGFTSDYSKEEYSFKGEKVGIISNDYIAYVDYDGFNILHVEVYEQE